MMWINKQNKNKKSNHIRDININISQNSFNEEKVVHLNLIGYLELFSCINDYTRLTY